MRRGAARTQIDATWDAGTAGRHLTYYTKAPAPLKDRLVQWLVVTWDACISYRNIWFKSGSFISHTASC